MKVLILTGRFGMGHYAVARTLVQEVQHAYPAASIVTEDIFEYMLSDGADRLYDAYTLLVNRGRALYNLFYRSTQRSAPGGDPMLVRLCLRHMDEMMGQFAPDVILSTLPFCSQLVSTYKRKTGNRTPLMTCVTDVTTHADWVAPGTDVYFVASEETRQGLVALGVPAGAIHVTGIPVQEAFHKVGRRPKGDERELLLMGGGLGLLPKERAFYRELDALPRVHTTVLTGRNEALFDKLYGQFEHMDVVGYTQDVPRYMAKADLVVTKPGGITLFETIHAELPILAFTPGLAQERQNAAFIQRQQLGAVLRGHPSHCVAEIGRLLEDERALRRMRDNMCRLKSSLDGGALTRMLGTLTQRQVWAS